MNICKKIKTQREENNISQEQLAAKLDIEPKTIENWETGKEEPSISQIIKITQFFNISIDAFLSTEETLSADEINATMIEIDAKLKSDSFRKAFDFVKNVIDENPNCYELLWQIAIMLDAHKLRNQVPNASSYDEEIINWYSKALKSSDESIRANAADALFNLYFQKKEYEKAEKCLSNLSIQSPERKRKQALLFIETGRIEDAKKACEELLFSEYQTTLAVFQSLYLIAMQEGNIKRAEYIVNKQSKLARLFEMGEFHEESCKLELAIFNKDSYNTIEIMKKMLSNTESILGFSNSSLYKHMSFKSGDENYIKYIRENLMRDMQNEETYGYLKGNKAWEDFFKK